MSDDEYDDTPVTQAQIPTQNGHFSNRRHGVAGSRQITVPQDVASKAPENDSVNGRNLTNGQARSIKKRELAENGGRDGSSAKKPCLEGDSEEPSAAQSLLQNVDNLTQEKKFVPERIQHASQVNQSVPSAIRSITSRQAHCPLDQKSILESSGIECPPLPGHDKRPGTMPQKLFELFTAQADQASSASRLSSGHITEVKLPAHEQAEQAEEEEDDLPTQQVSGSQWPASPDYAARVAPAIEAAQSPESSPISSAPSSAKPLRTRMQGLPPDSPPAAGQEATSASSVDLEPSRSGENALIAQPSKESASTKDQQSNLPTPSSDSVEDVDTSASDEEASDALSIMDLDRPHASASVPVSLPASTSGTRKPVEVERTPFPGKQIHRRQEMVPGSTFVPSTYADAIRTVHTSDPLPEMYSSDSEISNKRRQDRQEYHNTQRSTQMGSQAKDKDQDAVQHERKMQEHREWRRNLLKPITKVPTQSSQPQVMAEETLVVETSTESRVDAKSKSADETSVQESFQPSTEARANTSQVNGNSSKSHHEAARPSSPPARPAHPSQQTSLRSTTRVPSISAHHGVPTSYGALFERFKAAYSDYGGTVKHFASACEMLAKPNVATRVHRSLMDDFVFHYANTFLPYVIESAASGEGSMPYTDYFFTLDDLTHWKKVLSSAGLHAAGTTRSARTSELSQVQKRRVSYGLPSVSIKDENSISTTPNVDTLTHAPAHVQDQFMAQDLEKAASHVSVEFAGQAEPSEMAKATAQSQDASQQSSVESWLEQTAHARAPSPELGTPGIDRSAEQSPDANGLQRRMLTNKRGTISSLAVDPPAAKRARGNMGMVRPASASIQEQVQPTGSTPRLSVASALDGAPSTAPPRDPYVPPRSTPKRKSLPASFGITKSLPPSSTAPAVVARATVSRSSRPPDGSPASSPALDPALKGFITDSNAAGPSRSFVRPQSRRTSTFNPFIKPPPKPRIVSSPSSKGKEPEIPPSSATSRPPPLAKKTSSTSLSSDKKKLNPDWWRKEDTPYQRFASNWMSSGG
ncbi:uncharacterized protein AB675_266 [Cyphellophora attinorum]|uniref:Uncharacterized protein n=1 Tax=Cyphellophora attinorum TaxID=1664694 RepID=A0A0N1HGX6_9EURO|nr:uncharacterized protein AB675_266 [Phialophora attinorum]KPI45592.1 hypothetical protein AB675_266 [Phialophora attinorum]